MKFYIVENNQSVGPFTVEELKAKGIKPDTPVWREGMADWTSAGMVPEFASVFGNAAAPAPAAPAMQMPQNGVCPKTWLLESILCTLFCCLPFGGVGIVFAAQVQSKFSAGDFAGAAAASKSAGKWTKIGVVCGVIGIILYILLIAVAGLGTAFLENM